MVIAAPLGTMPGSHRSIVSSSRSRPSPTSCNVIVAITVLAMLPART
jgi:hypothetical protein